MYTSSILMLISWPVLIIITWFAIRLALHFYEKSQQKFERIMKE